MWVDIWGHLECTTALSSAPRLSESPEMLWHYRPTQYGCLCHFKVSEVFSHCELSVSIGF